MKNKATAIGLLAVLLALSAFTACKGAEGPAGPEGPQGPQGPAASGTVTLGEGSPDGVAGYGRIDGLASAKYVVESEGVWYSIGTAATGFKAVRESDMEAAIGATAAAATGVIGLTNGKTYNVYRAVAVDLSSNVSDSATANTVYTVSGATSSNTFTISGPASGYASIKLLLSFPGTEAKLFDSSNAEITARPRVLALGDYIRYTESSPKKLAWTSGTASVVSIAANVVRLQLGSATAVVLTDQ